MCEKDDLDEMYTVSRARDLSRRQFGALSLGVGLTAMLPRLALLMNRRRTKVLSTPSTLTWKKRSNRNETARGFVTVMVTLPRS